MTSARPVPIRVRYGQPRELSGYCRSALASAVFRADFPARCDVLGGNRPVSAMRLENECDRAHSQFADNPLTWAAMPWKGTPMRIFGQQHGAVGPSGLRSGPIRTIRKGGRWARRAVAVLAAVSAGALLLTASAGAAPTFAASSPTPVIAARTIPAPKQAPNPRNITARVASTCATAAYKAG